MPLMYPELSEREADEVKDLRDRISRFVNGNSANAAIALGIAMADDHRTLVQSKGHLVNGFLKELQRHHKEGYTDLRNKAIAEWADEVLTKVDGPHLPFI